MAQNTDIWFFAGVAILGLGVYAYLDQSKKLSNTVVTVKKVQKLNTINTLKTTVEAGAIAGIAGTIQHPSTLMQDFSKIGDMFNGTTDSVTDSADSNGNNGNTVDSEGNITSGDSGGYENDQSDLNQIDNTDYGAENDPTDF